MGQAQGRETLVVYILLPVLWQTVFLGYLIYLGLQRFAPHFQHLALFCVVGPFLLLLHQHVFFETVHGPGLGLYSALSDNFAAHTSQKRYLVDSDLQDVDLELLRVGIIESGLKDIFPDTFLVGSSKLTSGYLLPR